MNEETPTPITDAAKFKILSSLQSGTDYVVHAHVAEDLERENAELRLRLKSATSHTDFLKRMGITLLDAKWLDPACHEGCQSLVIKAELTAALAREKRLREALEEITAIEPNHFGLYTGKAIFQVLAIARKALAFDGKESA
jgi:hypothetical protein